MNEVGAKKAGAAFFRKDRKVDNCYEGALQYFWVRSKIAMPSSSSPLTIIHHHSPDLNILLLGLSRVSMSLDQFSAPQQPSKSSCTRRSLTRPGCPSLSSPSSPSLLSSLSPPTTVFQVKLYEEILDETRYSCHLHP